MVRFSAVGKQAGMTMEQVAGVLTGGYEILGDSEKVASGLTYNPYVQKCA